MYFDLAQLTCDTDSRRILSSVDRKQRSAKEIAHACDMSISRCYRMIRMMEDYRLLRRAEVDGREIMYVSNLHSIELSMVGDHMSLVVSYRDGSRKEVRMGPEDLERRALPGMADHLLDEETSAAPSSMA